MECNYDIAISYQSKLEKEASRIADYLKLEKLTVFFAPARQSEIVSEKLHQVLYDIYKNKSLVKVLMVTEEYLKGEWTSLEMRMSMDSARDESRRLIIINYIGEDLPENLKSFIYLDGHKMHEDEIASIIVRRVKDIKKTDVAGEERKQQEIGDFFTIQNNGGIMAGDGAIFGDVHFNN